MIGETIYFFAIIIIETFYFWAILVEIDQTKDEIKEKIDTLLSGVWVWTREENR